MGDHIEEWGRLQELFHLAEEVPDEERQHVLARACDDAELCRRALAILSAAMATEQTTLVTSAAAALGNIGPQRLLRQLGAGGLGVVYLAERLTGGSVRLVAIKLMAPHAGGPAFMERFYREQQILASLDHPNITHMIDAGVSDGGQPYLVMEYVDGVHLNQYCDELRLSIAARVNLFLQVCEAVAYAHRNLIVHLDLKPSNILVTKEGTVKLLDFGTSKVIEADSLLTTTVLATPAYASPEQLRNEAVTTACDTYSLGAVLFEMLSGRRPGESSSVAVMIERAMREEEPERLTTFISSEAAERRGESEGRLRQVLAGDLATIVSKCLRPRPADRYLSLELLMDDLRRYLEGRPVLARPQTTWYRLTKFVRRNHKSVAVAGLSVLLLIASVSYALWQQQRAVREGQRAVRMSDFLYKLFRLANSNYTGKSQVTVPEFLRLGVRMLPQYISDPSDLRAAQMSLAESMYENDDLVDAAPVFQQTTTSAHAAGDTGAEAESKAFLGHIAYQQGNNDLGAQLTAEALELSHHSNVSPAVQVWSATWYAWDRENLGFRQDSNVKLLRFAVKESIDNRLPPHETADALYNLGQDLEIRGELTEAQQRFSQALAVYGNDPSVLCDRSQLLGELAFVKQMNGDMSSSVPDFKQAYDGAKACSGPESIGALTELDSYLDALTRTGRGQEALPMMLAAMPAWRKALGEAPGLAEPLYYASEVNLATGHYPEAVAAAKEAIDVQTGKVAPTDRRFGVLHLMWARGLVGENRPAEALPHAQIAVDLLSHGVSPGAKKVDVEAHQLLVDLQTQLQRK